MKRISEPGVYDLPIDTYHGDCCDGPSVSASGLWSILSECPAIFWSRSALNPKRIEEAPSAALDFGRAAHALMLGEPEFNSSFVVCPHDKLNANPGRAWHEQWKASIAAGTEKRTLVRADDFEAVKAMADALKSSPQVSRAFADGKPERSLIWKDSETGIWLKSRPDWLPDDPATGWLVEFKTTRSAEPRQFSLAAFDYGYHVQAALAFDAVQAVLGCSPAGIAHVVQEKTAPYIAELRLFTPEQIEFGRLQYRRAMKILARCLADMKAGKPERIAWLGYTDQPTYFETPFRILKAMEQANDDPESEGDDPSRFLRAG